MKIKNNVSWQTMPRSITAEVFGCYGWSGESVRILKESIGKAGFAVVDDGLKALWNPTEDARRECRRYGQKLSAALD